MRGVVLPTKHKTLDAKVYTLLFDSFLRSEDVMGYVEHANDYMTKSLLDKDRTNLLKRRKLLEKEIGNLIYRI